MSVNRVDPCADCQRTKHIAARDLCRGCYKRHRLTGTLWMWQRVRRAPLSTARPNVQCLRCDRVMPHHGARTLLSLLLAPERPGPPRPSTPGSSGVRAELLAEYDHLRRAGVDLTEAARRLGISRDGLAKAIERAGKRAA